MNDGSLIKGEIKEESIKVKASLGVGVVNLNPKDILSIVGGEKVDIRLRDGSLIKGEIVGNVLKVKAAFGELLIDTKLLVKYEASATTSEGATTTKPGSATLAAEKAKEEKQAKEEKRTKEEVATKGDALESKTFDLPSNTVWQSLLTTLNGMGEKTNQVLKESGQITTESREYTEAKTLSAAGFEPGQIKYSLQVFVISLTEGKTKVNLNVSFKKKKMKLFSEDTEFPEGLKYLRAVFYERLEKVITP
jgi:predicted flap endonuclease-1-like 5' DNA nuclease